MTVATLNLALGNTVRKFLYRKGTGDEVVIVQALQNRAYDFAPLRRAGKLSEFCGRLTRTDKAPLIVDAGANIGASTVYFASAFPGARLVAVEPDRDNFALLCANTTDLPVECLHAALAASLGIAAAAEPDRGIADRRTASPDDTGARQGSGGRTIAEIYENMAPVARPFVVKIDIGRFDDGLFGANTDWVDRTPVIIAQLDDWLVPGTKNTRAFVDCIADRNRDLVYLHDCLFSLDRTPGFAHAEEA